MEVFNLRPLSAIPPSVSDSELLPVSRVENTARSGKDSSSRRQPPARRQDDVVELSGQGPVESSAPAAEATSDGQISFFA
jgi:hypothetical protein